MHRTFSIPRLLGCASVLIALAMHAAISAQDPRLPRSIEIEHAQHIELAVGASRTCQMTTQADLKRVENPNSRVVRVERIADRNNAVLLVAEGPGRSLVTFVDQNDRAETHEVIVTSANAVPLPLPVPLLQGPAGPQKMLVNKGTFQAVNLPKIPLGGTQITVGNVVDVQPVKGDPKAFTIHGVRAGNTRVTFFFDKERKESLAYDIEVPFEDRVMQLRELIKKIAPNDNVEVHSLIGSAAVINKEGVVEKEATIAVLLTGTVASAETARLIDKAANAIFPPTLLKQASSEGGVNVESTKVDQLNVINQIRVGGVHQVQIEVVVAVVNRSEARNMSFSWNFNGPNWFLSSVLGAGGITSVLTPALGGNTQSFTPGNSGNMFFGILNNNNSFMGILSALRTEGLTKILAEPRVTTLSGRPAYIVSGGETPLLTATGLGASTVTYKQFGTVVHFLPVVLGNNKIHLEVRPEVSEIDNSAGINVGGNIVPGFKTRSAQVTVQIEDGQTIAIGGLISNTVNATISRVPFLGDLPFVGTAFTTKNYKEEEQELLILVTPRLVDPVDCSKIPKWLPGRETRTPDDFELFLEGIMEAPRGQRSVLFAPKYYKGAHTLAPNYGQIPCGDGSSYQGIRGGRGNCADGSCGPRYNTLKVPSVNDHTMPRLAMPAISTPGFQGGATASPRGTVEQELPAIVTPTPAGPPISRQGEYRPILPPIGQ